VLVEPVKSAPGTPGAVYFSPGVRKYGTEVRVNRDIIAELVGELINSPLAGIGPDAQNI
jgi:hypothetical protein